MIADVVEESRRQCVARAQQGAFSAAPGTSLAECVAAAEALGVEVLSAVLAQRGDVAQDAFDAAVVPSSSVVTPSIDVGEVHVASVEDKTFAVTPARVPKWQLVIPCTKLDPDMVMTVPPV